MWVECLRPEFILSCAPGLPGTHSWLHNNPDITSGRQGEGLDIVKANFLAFFFVCLFFEDLKDAPLI